MATKPKAGGTKAKAKPSPKTKDEKQFERFIETARRLDAEPTGKAFEKAFEAIAPAKGRPHSRD